MAKTRIEELQEHTRDLVEALVTGKLEGGLLISGSGGVGKSRAVRDALDGLIAAGQPINVTYLDHVGPLRLYEELEKHKKSGEVLVLASPRARLTALENVRPIVDQLLQQRPRDLGDLCRGDSHEVAVQEPGQRFCRHADVPC